MKLFSYNLNKDEANGMIFMNEELAAEEFRKTGNIWMSMKKDKLFKAETEDSSVAIYKTRNDGYYLVHVVKGLVQELTVFNAYQDAKEQAVTAILEIL